MRRYDFLGIYLSVAYVLLGITSFIVCSCVEGPSPENVTGPSGSDMVCVFYFGIQLLVWIPIGCVLVALNVRRYQTSNDGPFFDVHRHWIGLVLGVVLLGNSYLALDGEGGFGSILLVSALVNLVPAAVFYFIGLAFTGNRRAELARVELRTSKLGQAEQAVPPKSDRAGG